MFIRSLLHSSQATVHACTGGHRCPDILELDAGDFAVIGTDITEVGSVKLPPGSGCAPHERIVRVPRDVFIRAMAELQATA